MKARLQNMPENLEKPSDDSRLPPPFLHIPEPDSLLAEVEQIMDLVHPDFDHPAIGRAFSDVLDLFAGRYPGYRACNTPYHDLSHTLDTLLATARLIHGASLSGERFSAQASLLALVAALLHDAGYIQDDSDHEGTGARHTATHVGRSADFAAAYLAAHGYSSGDIDRCRSMILCTDLALEPGDIHFADTETQTLAWILATADLAGQMAARDYLERLLLLYQELVEGGVPGIDNERDLLDRTQDFYESILARFADQYGGVNRYMAAHFAARWNLDTDPYADYAHKNMQHLARVLTDKGDRYRDLLRRSGIARSCSSRS